MFGLEDKTFKHSTNSSLLKDVNIFENHIVNSERFKPVMITITMDFSILGSITRFKDLYTF